MKSVKSPVVLIHGWAAGAGCFFKNVGDIAPDRALLLIDLPGFGESCRPKFSEDPEKDWKEALFEVFQLEIQGKFWLLGHSFGAYLAARLCLGEE